MGGRSSPFIFDQLPIALEWICRNKYLIKFLLHLLDDFLAVEDPSSTPQALHIVITLFAYLGVPCTPQSCRSHSVSRISGHNLRYSGYGGKTFTRKAAEAACSFGLICKPEEVHQEGAFKPNWIPEFCNKGDSPEADLPFPHD